MGATFCHLAALRSAIEFLFWDHWETAVLVQILDGGHGRLREQISAIWRPLGRRLHWETAVLGQILAGRSQEVTGGHGRLREVTGGYGGGKRRKVEEGQEIGWKKTKENEGKSSKQGENGGKWRSSEAQRRAASVGVRGKIACEGMRSDTEEGGAKGCKARRSLPKVLQMVWASNLVHTGL